jgi:hypothetical protein
MVVSLSPHQFDRDRLLAKLAPGVQHGLWPGAAALPRRSVDDQIRMRWCRLRVSSHDRNQPGEEWVHYPYEEEE